MTLKRTDWSKDPIFEREDWSKDPTMPQKASFPIELALEELRLTQAVISRKAEAEFKIRGWLYTLIAAITIGFLTEEVTLSAGEFFSVSLALILFFSSLEFIQIMDHSRAIKRSTGIENALCEGRGYDGPCLSETMTRKWGFKEMREALFNWHNFAHFWFPYILLLGILLLLSRLVS